MPFALHVPHTNNIYVLHSNGICIAQQRSLAMAMTISQTSFGRLAKDMHQQVPMIILRNDIVLSPQSICPK